jgi:hypothetical protein
MYDLSLVIDYNKARKLGNAEMMNALHKECAVLLNTINSSRKWRYTQYCISVVLSRLLASDFDRYIIDKTAGVNFLNPEEITKHNMSLPVVI